MNLFAPAPTSARTGLAFFLIRAIVGLGFIFHGMMKVHAGFSDWMGPHGFAPTWLQSVVTIVEVCGGGALIAGLFTPLVTFLLAIDMIVAIFRYHLPAGGHFVGGRAAFEVPLDYLIVAIAMLVAGPGRFSLDAMFFKRR